MKDSSIIIAVDFDGTCVTHEYPKVGKDIGAAPVLKCLVRHGWKIILNTMRSGKELQDAVKWFEDRDIPLYGINENPAQKSWTTSPKVYAHYYVDDAAVGCPLYDVNGHRPFVSWEDIVHMLTTFGPLKLPNEDSMAMLLGEIKLNNEVCRR